MTAGGRNGSTVDLDTGLRGADVYRLEYWETECHVLVEGLDGLLFG